jgi:ATP-dependent Lon protease
MTNTALDSKICDTFRDFAVDKGLIARLGLSRDDRHIPSYVMDWIVTYNAKQEKSTGRLQDAVVQFVQKHLPAKGEKGAIKFRLSQGETLTLLDAISVEVRLGKEIQYLASIPCIDEQKAKIDATLIRQNEGLLHGSVWGAAKICYEDSADDAGIRIVDFKPMQTGRVSLEAYFECRKAFTVEEWLDVVVRTMGYEPTEYAEDEKIWLICRLLPVVQNRVNMMELAPPGSGKSFVFNNISRNVWLTAAQISAAVLFYNRQNKRPGLLTRYDLLVLDEAQSIRFTDAPEIQAQLKGYLEQGVYTRGDCAATAECGLMLLANIELKQDPTGYYQNGKPAFQPLRTDYIRRLPEVFLDPPLIDRFHGIIPGWRIPPFETQQQARGYGLKADYFAEVCHSLRSATHIAQEVRAQLRLSGGQRDCTAVERLACGLAKLLLIAPDHPRFEELVVRPAKELRGNIRTQLHELDPRVFPSELQCARFGTTRPPKTLGRIDTYELIELIARGGAACVYRGLDTATGSVVAIKQVATVGNEFDERALRREMDIYERLMQLENPHILVVKKIVREVDTYALVTEYADGGSLWDLMGEATPDGKRRPMDEQTVKEIALAVLDGLAVLHDNDIIHRDVKPQNILRCDDIWKIADFGISKLTNNPVTGFTFQGAHSAPWAPREQIDGAPAHPSADIYALGRVVGFLLTGSTVHTDILSLLPKWRDILTLCIDELPDNRPDVHALIAQVEGVVV